MIPSTPAARSARARPSAVRAVARGLIGRCPNCGKGALFRRYLKQVDRCAACDEAYGHLRADDGPPWLTIIVVGHIVVPLAYFFERDTQWPEWVAMTVWPGLALVLCLLLLPLAKGVFLGLIWSHRAPGSELP